MVVRWVLAVGLAIPGLVVAAQAEPEQHAGFDYPTLALKNGWEGTVFYTATVGIDGRVKTCIVTQSSGHEVLDQAACDLIMKRAHFAPATDGAGHTVERTYSNKLVFKLPR